MLLVIVGAGASYDSDADYPPNDPHNVSPNARHRLPLADQLFSTAYGDILAKYPNLLQSVRNIRQRPAGQTVEEVLAEFARDAERNPLRLKQLSEARFYIADVIRTCQNGWCHGSPTLSTNMMWLVDVMHNQRGPKGERPIFVTFNYDTIIEKALSMVQPPFSSIEDYPSTQSIPLFKLHGSYDWVRILSYDRAALRSRSTEMLDLLHLYLSTAKKPGNDYVKSGDARVNLGHAIWAPAIAVPVKEKFEYECPEDHVDILSLLLPKVTNILSIGWRAGEQHFLNLLQERIQSGVYVHTVAGGSNGNADAEATLKILGNHLSISTRCQPFGDGFSSYMQSKQYQPLLNLQWPT